MPKHATRPCAQEQAKPRESFIIFAKRQKQAKPATRLQIGKVDEFCLCTFSPCPCSARFGCSSFGPRSNGAKVSARGKPRQQRCRKPRKPPRQQRLRSPLGVDKMSEGARDFDQDLNRYSPRDRVAARLEGRR